MSTKTPAKGHTTKHVHHRKHQQHHKKHQPVKQHKSAAKAPAHNVHAVAKPAAHAKPRGYAVGDLLPVCAFEAAAQWLRLEGGVRVTDDDVAMRWEALGELSIPEALAAFGLDGAGRDLNPRSPISGGYAFGRSRLPHGALSSWPPAPVLILGIDVPGPHCVLATPDGWWSWGELHDPWPARIEEAWAVSCQ